MAIATFSPWVFDEVIEALRASMNERSPGVMKSDQNHFARSAWKCYILAALALECIINEFLVLNSRFLETHDQDSIQELVRTTNIREKYRTFPGLFGVSGYDTGKEPFQGFECLIKLRDDLVHYKMRDYELEKKEPPYWGRLKAANVLLVSGGDPGMAWLHNICTYQGALWACNTMNNMRESFCALFKNHESGEEMCRYFRSLPAIPDLAGDYEDVCKEDSATSKE